jgi:hypothetical protein
MYTSNGGLFTGESPEAPLFKNILKLAQIPEIPGDAGVVPLKQTAPSMRD